MSNGADESNVDGAAQGANPGGWTDPYRAYNFELVVNGVTRGHFTHCTGLGVKVDTMDYREAGGDPLQVHRIPGRVRYGDITLKYGLTESTELWDWFWSGVQGEVDRRSVTIRLLGSDGTTEATSWELINAWVSEWRAAPLDAMASQLAIETMTLVFERLER